MSSSIDQFKLKPLTLAIRRETQHKGGFLGKVLRVVVPIAIPFIAPAILPVSGIFGKLALNMGMGALTSKLTGGNPLTGALLAGAGTVASQAIGGLKNLPKTGGGTISTATNAANPSGFQFMGGLGQTGRDAAASLAQSGIPGISHTIDTATGQLVGTTGFNQNLSNVAFNDIGNVVTDAAGNVLSDTTSNLVTDAAGNVVSRGNLLPAGSVDPITGIPTGSVNPRPTQFFQQGVDTTGLNLSNVRTTNIDPRIAANLRDAPTISNTQTTQRNPDNALLKNQQRVDPTTNRVLTGTQGSGATHGTDFFSRMKRKASKFFGNAADNLIQNPNRLMAVLSGLASDSTARTNLGVAIGSDVEAFNADILKADEADELTVGFSAAAYDCGVKSSGTFTPSVDLGNFQFATNGGAHTLAVPAKNCTMVILYKNNASAGTITTSGYTVTDGDTLTTTNGHEFFFYITRINDGSTTFSLLTVKALQ